MCSHQLTRFQTVAANLILDFLCGSRVVMNGVETQQKGNDKQRERRTDGQTDRRTNIQTDKGTQAGVLELLSQLYTWL